MLNYFKGIKRIGKTIDEQRYANKINNDRKYHERQLLAELVKHVHAIEKGLSLARPRDGFGVARIEAIFSILDVLKENLGDPMVSEVFFMAYDALNDYLNYHEEINYSNSKILKFKQSYEMLTIVFSGLLDKKDDKVYGGIYHLDKEEVIDENKFYKLEELILTRHSIREFSKEPVDMKKIEAAVELASHCPSACNRQGYRVYVLDKSKKDILGDWLDGVGGFSDEIDKFLIITGLRSSYKTYESGQYIVSASIFLGYLSLTLHASGLGACIIQRPIYKSKKWIQLASKFDIPGDEQIICMIGVGNLNEKFAVPVSHRMPIDTLMKIL